MLKSPTEKLEVDAKEPHPIHINEGIVGNPFFRVSPLAFPVLPAGTKNAGK